MRNGQAQSETKIKFVLNHEREKLWTRVRVR